jgi:Protein of unknown function (DUF1757)
MTSVFGEGMDISRRVDRSQYSDPSVPEFPAKVLLSHIVYKGLQYGSLGGIAIAPLWALSRARPLSVVFPRVVWTGAAVGLAGSFGLLAARGFQGALSNEGVDDRAFRLSKNVGQVEMDQASGLGGVLGASIGAIFGKRALRSVLTGSLCGFSAAGFGYLLQRQMNSTSGDEASVSQKLASAKAAMQ